mgnify:CR=1 FL=1
MKKILTAVGSDSISRYLREKKYDENADFHYIIEFPKETVSKLVQFLKVEREISIVELPIFADFKLVHPLNVVSLISVIPFPKVASPYTLKMQKS